MNCVVLLFCYLSSSPTLALSLIFDICSFYFLKKFTILDLKNSKLQGLVVFIYRYLKMCIHIQGDYES